MSHVPVLDAFRAIAILLVMFSHIGLEHLVPGGFGVTLFFFLSGYLIISILRSENEKTGAVSLSGFYIKRFVRIFPPMYITYVIVLFLIGIGWIHYKPDGLGVLRDLLFLTNYPSIWEGHGGVPMPLWSLDVEEHFYILFSAAYVLLLRRMKSAMAAFWCFVACVVFLGIRVYLASTLPDYSNNYYWSHTRMDSILAGGCLALWQNPAIDERAWKPSGLHLVLALLALILTLVIRDPFFRETLRYSVQSAALFVVFSFAIGNGGFIAWFAQRPFVQLTALLSYTLYLVHYPILRALQAQFPEVAVGWLAIPFFAFSYAYALLMRHWVEVPLGPWRSRLLKRTRRGAR